MKIGILTQPLRTNYGGLLQAYALQKVLKDMGHEPCVICRKNDRISFLRLILSFIKRAILRFILRRDITLIAKTISKKELDYISVNTNRFISENIIASEEMNQSQLFPWVKSNDIRACVIGSDQVWRPMYSPCITNYYLDFIPASSSIKRIAYAASFGVDNWEYKPQQTKICKSLVQKFDFVSVREDSGVNLCKEYFDIEASHVLDPTLLLSKEDYTNLVEKDNIQMSKGNLMVYVLDKNKDKAIIVDKVASDLGLIPFSVMPEENIIDVKEKGISKCVFPPVTEWLKGFIDAEFVVTDSFHGTVFSIIFNKPFIAIGNKGRGLTRFTSLLKLFGLSNRLISSLDELDSNLLTDPLNFTLINSILYNEREKSRSFLTNSLM